VKDIVILFALLSLIGCDQATKSIARGELRASPPTVLLHGFIRLEYAENTGGFLSLGSDLPDQVRFMINVVMGAVLLAGTVFLFVRLRRLNHWKLAGWLLALGGAGGNLVDRFINQGRVVDFLVLGAGEVTTGVFNIADVFILAGVFILVINSGRRGQSPA
jgi:signal peptidase II